MFPGTTVFLREYNGLTTQVDTWHDYTEIWSSDFCVTIMEES